MPASNASAGLPIALITGGAQRLGKAMALALASRGVGIALHYRRSRRQALAVHRAITALGAPCALYPADLAQRDEAAALPRQAAAHFGRLDILVNNASVFLDTPLGRTGEKDLNLLLDLNLKAPYFLAEAAAPFLRRSKGCIINLLDEGALRPWKTHLAYIASKAGLAALTIGLAKALAPQVRANGIAPGPVLLPAGTSRAQARRSAEATLLRRLGTPEAVAQAAVFLALDAGYITGEILHVDGGRRWARSGGRP
jgi:pteridine reductase